jgi:formylglycine-generating enzyme required for sulfatase activity
MSPVQANLIIDTAFVGNPGNAGELSGISAGGWGPDRVCGAVNYVYQISTFETKADQYTEFLNAVAATDTYGLYSQNMWSDARGCKISRSGSPGSFTYAVDAEWADRPVNFVSWRDAARFCNWMHNGQPTGPQNAATTEDGSYDLSGGGSGAIAREDDATWVIPSEDEWYKSAYHKNDGITGNYWDYPTSTDVIPSNDLVGPDPGNNANFWQGGETLGGPYYRSEAGEFQNSESPYGTFDQGGNVWEWTEATLYGLDSQTRGGSFSTQADTLHAAHREFALPSTGAADIGFRVVRVPEPAAIGLLVIGGIAVLRRRR